MSEFKVIFPSLKSAIDNQKMLELKLRQIQNSTNAIASSLDFKVKAREQIQSRLRKADDEMDQLLVKIKSFTRGAEEAYMSYLFTEGKLTGEIVPIIGPLGNSGDATGGVSIGDVAIGDWFEKDGERSNVINGAVITGAVSGTTTLFGADAQGSAEWSVLNGEVEVETKSVFTSDEFVALYGVTATGALATGSVSGNIGELHGEISGKVGVATASGEAKMSLIEDGKFNPMLKVGAAASVSAAQGAIELGAGDENLGASVKASGDVLHASAQAEAGIGKLGTDENGNDVYGVAAEASAMACVAKGEVEGGFSFLGIEIGVSVEGYAGAAGVEVGGSVTTEGATASFGGALGLGGGVEISVDWSGADWVGDAVDGVADFVSDGLEWIGEWW